MSHHSMSIDLPREDRRFFKFRSEERKSEVSETLCMSDLNLGTIWKVVKLVISGFLVYKIIVFYYLKGLVNFFRTFSLIMSDLDFVIV